MISRSSRSILISKNTATCVLSCEGSRTDARNPTRSESNFDPWRWTFLVFPDESGKTSHLWQQRYPLAPVRSAQTLTSLLSVRPAKFPSLPTLATLELPEEPSVSNLIWATRWRSFENPFGRARAVVCRKGSSSYVDESFVTSFRWWEKDCRRALRVNIIKGQK